MRPSRRRSKGVQVQDLPNECWALVLSRLKSKEDRDAAALTCRRWRSLEALSRHSLRFLDCRKDQWPRLHIFLLQALHSFPNILSITIGGLCDLPYSFPRVFQHKGFAQLAFLDISVAQDHMNDHLLQCLALGCPSLTHLSLCTSTITDAGMHSLAHGCPLLRFLDMSCCSISDKGIDVLLTKCLDIREFLVEEADIKGWAFRHGKLLERLAVIDCHLSDSSLAEGLWGPTALRTLSLAHSHGEATLSSIGECCKGLEVLNLKWSESLDDVAVEKIAEGCKNLRDLDVSWCHNITLDGWEALARSCKKLENLAVTGCEEFDPNCLFEIQEGCPNLCLLKVSDYFAPHPSLKRFQVSRPAVEVKFYDDDNFECDSPFFAESGDGPI